MEFEDEHDNEEHEEEEEEDDDDEDDNITIPPPTAPPAIYLDSVQTRLNNPSPSSDMRRSTTAVRYRECLKNHAVNIGGHALDGCGEFMPAGHEGSLDALKCAACNCHRNFHRKEPAPPPSLVPQPPPPQFSPFYRAPPPAAGYLHVAAQHNRQTVVPALPSSNTSGGTQSGGEMGDEGSHPSSSGGGGGGGIGMTNMMSKKRHRTKFTQEQKDKMLGFAEKLGWRIQKHDEAAVQQFCAETLVKRQVLKVWMHNNKHTLGKKP
ncbi:hypothetical protein vseg_004650 [Gypsophila vaccaria]